MVVAIGVAESFSVACGTRRGSGNPVPRSYSSASTRVHRLDTIPNTASVAMPGCTGFGRRAFERWSGSYSEQRHSTIDLQIDPGNEAGCIGRQE